MRRSRIDDRLSSKGHGRGGVHALSRSERRRCMMSLGKTTSRNFADRRWTKPVGREKGCCRTAAFPDEKMQSSSIVYDVNLQQQEQQRKPSPQAGVLLCACQVSTLAVVSWETRQPCCRRCLEISSSTYLSCQCPASPSSKLARSSCPQRFAETRIPVHTTVKGSKRNKITNHSLNAKTWHQG